MEAYKRLAYQSEVILRLGRMLQGAGASAYRVKSSMATVGQNIGIDAHQSLVTMNEIVATSYGAGTFRTEVVENRGVGVNNDLIDRVNRHIAGMKPGTRVEDLESALDRISSRPPIYGQVTAAFAAGIACSGFGFLNGCGPLQMVAVFIAAMLGQFLRGQLMHRGVNHFGAWMLCATVAASIYMLCILAYQSASGASPAHGGGVIAAILFLVPGVPLVTSIIELVRADFSAAVSRLAYALSLIAAAAAALWIITGLFHWPLSAEPPQQLDAGYVLPLQFLASFAGAWGFAILFKTPWKATLLAASIGAVVNVARLWLVSLGWPVPILAAGAAILIGLAAALVARFTHYTRVSLSVPGAVIMIPGVYLYTALADMSAGSFSNAADALASAVLIILAIGFGLAISRLLTDPAWLVSPGPQRARVERVSGENPAT